MSLTCSKSISTIPSFHRCCVDLLSPPSGYAVDVKMASCWCFWNWLETDAVDDVRRHMTLYYCAQLAALWLIFQLWSSPCMSPETTPEPYEAKRMCVLRRNRFDEKQNHNNGGHSVQKSASVYYLSLRYSPELKIPFATVSPLRKGERNGQLGALLRSSRYPWKHILCQKPPFTAPCREEIFRAHRGVL